MLLVTACSSGSDDGSGGDENEPNSAPVADFTANLTDGTLPLAISFDANGSSDADGNIASYTWDFGDGELASGVLVDHTFDAIGNFEVTLTVTDNDGDSSQSMQVVVVRAPSIAHVIDILL